MDEVHHMTSADKELNAALRKENLEARKHYAEEGMKRLMGYMCLGAVKDWMRANMELDRVETRMAGTPRVYRETLKKDMTALREDCEKFFDSDIFTFMTGLDGKEDAVGKLSKLPYGTVACTIDRQMGGGKR